MNTSIDATAAVTVTARLTPMIPSAIATIAVYGPSALEIVARLVKTNHPSEEMFPLGRVRYGLWKIVDGDDAAEQVVVCRTESQTIEIHCHGGNAVCQMILRDLVAAGCRNVSAADFPLDTDCEIKREATIDLQRATTDRAAAVLLDQLNGALGAAFSRIDVRLHSEGKSAVRSEVHELMQWSELGLHLVEPWQVVLAGPPNVGKSSLVNAIAGSERAIVHADPGTTRDWVEVLTAIDGWPVTLSDTAGIRESEDVIEREGICRALERVAVADLVVLVVDATVGWTRTHDQLKAAAVGKRTLVVWNKIDLWSGDASLIAREVVRTSACNKIDINPLLIAISRALVPEVPTANAAVPFRERHLQLLREFS